MYLPTRAVIRETYLKIAQKFGDPSCDIEDAKIRAALAWPRMMVTSKSSGDLFEIVSSLFTGILSEQPASKGNPSLAIFLVMLTLRRNGMMLDISNEEMVQLFANIAKGQLSEKALINFFRQKSIPVQY